MGVNLHQIKFLEKKHLDGGGQQNPRGSREIKLVHSVDINCKMRERVIVVSIHDKKGNHLKVVLNWCQWVQVIYVIDVE